MIPIRDENPTRTTPFVTVGLIAINLAVFVYQFTLSGSGAEQFVYKFGAIPALLTRDWNLLPQLPTHWPTLITSMFIHGGIMHLGGNMLYLWIFGNNVEDYLGHARFLLFYLIGGIAAAASHAIGDLGSSIPMVGASGAISAILGAYILQYPRAKVVVMIWFFFFLRFIRVYAVVVLGIWFLMQLSGVLSSAGGGPGVAWLAHIGGFAFGLLTVKIFGISRRRTARIF